MYFWKILFVTFSTVTIDECFSVVNVSHFPVSHLFSTFALKLKINNTQKVLGNKYFNCFKISTTNRYYNIESHSAESSVAVITIIY